MKGKYLCALGKTLEIAETLPLYTSKSLANKWSLDYLVISNVEYTLSVVCVGWLFESSGKFPSLLSPSFVWCNSEANNDRVVVYHLDPVSIHLSPFELLFLS